MKMHVTSAALIAMMIAASPVIAATATTAPAAGAAAPAAAMKAPAMKKATTHYYIAEAADTKACSVVMAKPDGKTATMVGKYWYSSMAKANAAMKKAAACKSA